MFENTQILLSVAILKAHLHNLFMYVDFLKFQYVYEWYQML